MDFSLFFLAYKVIAIAIDVAFVDLKRARTSDNYYCHHYNKIKLKNLRKYLLDTPERKIERRERGERERDRESVKGEA